MSLGKVAAEAEQWQPGELGHRIRETVAEVEAGRVAPLAVAQEGGPRNRPVILSKRQNGHFEARQHQGQVKGGAVQAIITFSAA